MHFSENESCVKRFRKKLCKLICSKAKKQLKRNKIPNGNLMAALVAISIMVRNETYGKE